MRQHLLTGVLAAAGLASSVTAAGTPVLVPRASTTLTPITVTGNGMQSNCTEQETELMFLTAFYQGTERFYIRGAGYGAEASAGKSEIPDRGPGTRGRRDTRLRPPQ